MNFHILTLFPEMVMGGLGTSITGRAVKQQKISIEAVNIRDYTTDKHRRVDDYPYGGGAGMLMQAQPVYDAWQAVCEGIKKRRAACGNGGDRGNVRTVYVTPQGTAFSQKMAGDFAKEEDLIILCGHYEGIDERVLEETVTDYVSIGDYVLTGGELAAMVMVDAISRLVPGVLNNDMSAETESFCGGLLEYPQYTRPESWHGRQVPKLLLSGNQKEIDRWRLEQSVDRTRKRRPELYRQYQKLQECKEWMMGQKLLHMDMIELINRGRAELLFCGDREILLQDVITGIDFYTNLKDGEEPWEAAKRLEQEVFAGMPCCPARIVFHQKEIAEAAAEGLSLHIALTCTQAVLTRREKLPVRGLYRPDGQPMESGSCQGLTIRPLGQEHGAMAEEQYHSYDGEGYIRERIAKKAMYGAFFGEELAGFVGFHAEGSIGMLEVFPQYRRRHIGKALETFILNKALEMGHIPYGQMAVGNQASKALQQSLGLYMAKGQLVWAEFLQEGICHAK